MEDAEVCPKCGAKLRQDEDVLDTWFSSQLWPFATQGWPDTTEELDKTYPTQMLSTARDIMGLWVARMVMSSLYFTDQIPFKDVIIHPTVMAADGKQVNALFFRANHILAIGLNGIHMIQGGRILCLNNL